MEDNLSKEFWQQFLAALFRKGLFAVGSLLEGYGYISHSQSTGFSSAEVALYLAGFALQLTPVLWQAAKTKFNISFVRAAYSADSKVTPLSVVKNDVLNTESKVTSV